MFQQIKPLMEQTKEIMNIHRIRHTWHEFFPEGFILLLVLAFYLFLLKLFFAAESLKSMQLKTTMEQ